MAVALAPSFRPFRVFVSYSSHYDVFAQTLIKHLEGEGKISCFFAPRDIPALEEWQPRLSSEIRKSDLVLFLYTPEAVKSEYVRFEVSEAAGHGRPVWLVKERNSALDLSFASYQFTRRNAFTFLAGQEDDCFIHLREALSEEWERLNRGIIRSPPIRRTGIQTVCESLGGLLFWARRGRPMADRSPHESA